MKKEVIAIEVADLHLSHRGPSNRTAKPDWYEIMAYYLDQLTALQIKYDHCPIVVAGDFLDHWNQPPELINFLIDELPENIYGIPGQHDLPNHSYDHIHRSAYWTLVEAGKINDIKYPNRMIVPDQNLALYSFPRNAK